MHHYTAMVYLGLIAVTRRFDLLTVDLMHDTRKPVGRRLPGPDYIRACTTLTNSGVRVLRTIDELSDWAGMGQPPQRFSPHARSHCSHARRRRSIRIDVRVVTVPIRRLTGVAPMDAITFRGLVRWDPPRCRASGCCTLRRRARTLRAQWWVSAMWCVIAASASRLCEVLSSSAVAAVKIMREKDD